ncbi:DUF1772 domain-containing protein [Dyadobacter chenwenxiniae]|uniref:DUF1772 domain-containing protein n=1 Tax=Dyadobacter chenwenxiniae TaxID=2906456 RepID=A0A9X1PM63_9BACT|nr:anthrone oxygenase family protein [Dyadobacter chenwenxiniae]MCF0062794.1 DUF1772 domain-containing protein [Dyadobacter chenwenxiniae]UON85031.1 DUF1772 domain-containing protein [Dyadobacter chenwenxiniae]
MKDHSNRLSKPMMHALYFPSLILTALLTGLSAGLFYAYSCSVNLGLARLPDNEYLRAMQEINKAILNPVFFMSFIGSIFLLAFASWLSHSEQVATFRLLLAATLVYAIGVFGVTVAGNVPLNDTLAGFNINAATADEIRLQRLHFERPWNKLHSIRTLCSVGAFLLVVIALCKTK